MHGFRTIYPYVKIRFAVFNFCYTNRKCHLQIVILYELFDCIIWSAGGRKGDEGRAGGLQHCRELWMHWTRLAVHTRLTVQYTALAVIAEGCMYTRYV